jgi:hypothetical protein
MHRPALQCYAAVWHDMKKKTFQTLTLLNNVNSSVARSKMFDVAAMVMEEWPGSRD